MRKPQQGMTTVEFALIAGLAMIVLFGVIEVARALFVWNTLVEATRRGARVAVVCPLNSPAIRRAAVFGGEDVSPVLNGLSTSNVEVEYIPNETNPDYVRVGITGYQHTLFIPFVGQTFDAPPFSTTLPVESLGYGAGC